MGEGIGQHRARMGRGIHTEKLGDERDDIASKGESRRNMRPMLLSFLFSDVVRNGMTVTWCGMRQSMVL